MENLNWWISIIYIKVFHSFHFVVVTRYQQFRVIIFDFHLIMKQKEFNVKKTTKNLHIYWHKQGTFMKPKSSSLFKKKFNPIFEQQQQQKLLFYANFESLKKVKKKKRYISHRNSKKYKNSFWKNQDHNNDDDDNDDGWH